MPEMKKHEQMEEIYRSGSLPWDVMDPPPEVIDLAAHLPVGRALDLGCGYGRASIYLAHLGWQVDGVDFVSQAITEAKSRAAQAGVADRTHFFHSPVTKLDFLQAPYDFALDVGCAHSFIEDELKAYHQELKRLLRPGGVYLLFGHLNEKDTPADQRRWLDEEILKSIFSTGFQLEKEEFGITQVNDQSPWRSAWFWFRKESS